MKKKLSLVFCIISCMILMAGCSLSLTKTNKNFAESTLESEADSFIASWFEYDFADAVENYADQLDEGTVELYSKSGDFQKDYGKMEKKVKTTFTINSDSATVNETILTDSGKKMVFTVTFDEEGNISSWNIDKYESLSDIMGRAGLNTIMSMCIVFVMLIFIALIIAQFKHINNMQNKQVETVKDEPVPTPVVAEPVEEELMDDTELIAVIAAAIAAASETESTDGLVIRSIIRR